MNQAWREQSTRVTGLFVSFNQERFVESALESALMQGWPMQLLISDDGSSDGTADCIRRVLARNQSLHQVVTRLDQPNLGLVRHLNELFALVEGEVVVIFAGDDVSYPQRVAELVTAFSDPTVLAAASTYDVIDSTLHGSAERPEDRPSSSWNLEEALENRQWFLPGCALAFRRRLLDEFGPLPSDCYAEDVLLGFRALLLGALAHVGQPLLAYRLLTGSLSKIAAEHGFDAQQFREAHRMRYSRVRGYAASMRRDLEVALRLGTLPRHLAARVEREVISKYAAAEAFHRAIAEQSSLRWLMPALRVSVRVPELRREAMRALIAGLSFRVFFSLKRMRASMRKSREVHRS